MLDRHVPSRAERALQPSGYVPEHSDDIDDVINELVDQNAVATITVPERERIGRMPTTGELTHPDPGPTVMVDSSLWLHRLVECRPQAIALGTIPPPLSDLAVYCVFDPAPRTEPIELVVDDDLLDDDIDGNPRADADDDAIEDDLDFELEGFDD
jgi:hypothetical protein